MQDLMRALNQIVFTAWVTFALLYWGVLFAEQPQVGWSPLKSIVPCSTCMAAAGGQPGAIRSESWKVIHSLIAWWIYCKCSLLSLFLHTTRADWGNIMHATGHGWSTHAVRCILTKTQASTAEKVFRWLP